MPKTQTNRNHKDTLFRLIFGEHKEYALALYNAINNSNYTDVDNLKIITLEDALYIDVKNDVGYIFHDVMNLIEQQSTFTPNMPLRGLGYFSDSYKEFVSETYRNASAIYSRKLLKIPTPRFYVLYNGTEDQEDQELRLSSAYEGEGDVEVVAHMININIGRNAGLLETCKPLKDYSELINRIRTQKQAGHADDEAVSIAVNTCIEEGILVEILKKERDKVENILIRGLTEEEKKELERLDREYYRETGYEEGREKGLEEGREEGREQGLEEGREQGISEAKFEDVEALAAEGTFTAEKACEILGVSYEDYLAHISEKDSQGTVSDSQELDNYES